MRRRARSSAAGNKTRVLALAAGIFAIVLVGCGSGEEGDHGAGGESGGPGAVTNSNPKDSGSLAGTQEASGKPRALGNSRDGSNPNRSDRSRSSGHGGSGRSNSAREAQGRKPGAGNGGSACPPGMSRHECRARIEAEIDSNGEPGTVVSAPSDCVKVLSEAQCKEILTAQKAAQEEAGPSVSPETCLQEYSREFCESRFKAQYEQQAAAQAGQ
jgi:hypothetical protein